jgi:hypothetical protein
LQNKYVKTAIYVILSLITLLIICNIIHSINSKKYSKILHQAFIFESQGQAAKSQESLLKIHNSKLVPNGIYSLAILKHAGNLLNEKKYEEAITIYKKLDNCFSCDSFYKDLARLFIVKIKINNKDLQENNFSQNIKKFESKSSDLKSLISEQRAIFALENKNYDLAKEIFEDIINSQDLENAAKLRAKDFVEIVKEEKN